MYSEGYHTHRFQRIQRKHATGGNRGDDRDVYLFMLVSSHLSWSEFARTGCRPISGSPPRAQGIHTEDVHSRIVRVFGDRANEAFLSQNVGY